MSDIPPHIAKRIAKGRAAFSIGICCPECGKRESITIDSRPSLSYVRRRRLCIEGHRFTTREEVVPEGQWIPDFQI